MHIQLIIFVAIYMIHSLFTWISKSTNTCVSWTRRYAFSEKGEREKIFCFCDLNYTRITNNIWLDRILLPAMT